MAWRTLLQRGAGTVRVSKVKGHATDKHVEDGEVQQEHKDHLVLKEPKELLEHKV